MNDAERLETAMNLLERAAQCFEHNAPDSAWFKEYFGLTGEHMILTDEGWEAGGGRATYEPGEVLDEVNAPEKVVTGG